MGLQEEFTEATSLGWGVFFAEAAKKHDLPECRIWAFGSRETNLSPRYLELLGDNGHGHGLFQIDDRSYPTWCAKRQEGNPSLFLWQDPRECALMGASVMQAKVAIVYSFVKRGHFSARGRVHQIITAPTPDQMLQIAIAAYNTGEGNALYGYIQGDIDMCTAHGNYSRDVLSRERIFKDLIDAHKI